MLAAVVLAALLADVEGPRSSLVMDPPQLNFGAQAAGANANLPVTLQNLATTPFSVAALILSNPGVFGVDLTGCPNGEVPALASCVVTVSFRPTAEGEFTGALSGGAVGARVELRGEGQLQNATAQPTPVVPPTPQPEPPSDIGTTAPDPTPAPPPQTAIPPTPPMPTPPPPRPDAATPQSPRPPPPALVTAARFAAESFSAQADVEESASFSVVLTNTGQTSIGNVTLQFDGGHAGDFTLQSDACALGAPASQCTARVNFTPNEAGTHEVTLVAQAGGVVLDRTLLRGVAQERPRPKAIVGPPRIQFTQPGQQETLIVRNSGTAPLQLAGVTLDNTRDFELRANECRENPTVQPNRECTIVVRFKGRQSARAQVAVRHNALEPSPAVEIVALTPTPAVKVPRLVGSELEKAVRDLRARGLSAGAITEDVRCDSVGDVVAQNPAPNSEVPTGSQVAMVIASIGPDPAIVPDVRNQPRSLAEQRIREARLSVLPRVRTEQTNELAPGSVMRVDPRPNTRVAPNCGVTLTLAAAPPPVTVPNYVGQTLAQAKQTLRGGFTGALSPFRLGTVTTASGAAVAPGNDAIWVVTAQNPRARQVIPRQNGTPIDLIVARSTADPDGPRIANPTGVRIN